MDPRVWGPHAWFFIETVVLSMPDDITDTSPYRAFLQSLKDVLPCPGCRQEYSEYLTTHPVPTSRKDIIEWVFTLHNTVRQRTGKQPRSTQSMMDYYASQYSQKSSYTMWILCALLIIGAIVYTLKK